MRSYFFVNPWWLSRFYSKAIFSLPDDGRSIYLTFDDGPTPEVTPWVLSLLAQYGAKATFFLVGSQVEKHPQLVKLIVEQGHAIGNHTYGHENGWRSPDMLYYKSVYQCQRMIEGANNAKLFRPPYGRIRLSQLSHLTSKGYKVVMWSHLAGDFDPGLNRQKSLQALCSSDPRSILVFHDSQKAFENLKELLPRVLDHFSTLHYSFQAIR